MFNLTKNNILVLISLLFSYYVNASPSEAINISINSTACLEISSDNIGARLIAADCKDHDDQKFIIDGNLIKLKSDQEKCLSYPQNINIDANILVWSCEANNSALVLGNYFFIDKNNLKLSSADGVCIKVSDKSKDIVIAECNNNTIDKIAFESEIKINNQCLQIDSDKNGSVARVDNCNKSINQQFFIYGAFIKPALNMKKCLDTFDVDINFSNLSKMDLIKVYINDCNQENINQQFELVNNVFYRSGLKEFCLSTFKGKKFDVNNPAVLVSCTQ
jgi:hypothetical protein